MEVVGGCGPKKICTVVYTKYNIGESKARKELPTLKQN